MLEIDEDRLLSDLYFMRNIFVSGTSNSIIKNNYSNFVTLNNVLARTTQLQFPLGGIFKDVPRVQKMMDDHTFKNINCFLNYVEKNEELIKNISQNYLNTLKEVKFQFYPFYKKIRGYNENDFKDLILSYFSTFGDKYYKIAKKYIEENRIEMGYEQDEKEYAGFFAYLSWLKTGYITTCYSAKHSISASSIIHEIGHAIDAETFLFPQQKNIPIFSDILLEIPSTTFELGFFDYLKDNHIDIDVGRLLINDRTSYLEDCLEGMLDTINAENIELDEYGVGTDENKKQHSLRENLIYGLGYYFAMHLNLIKENDMKEFLKVFNNLITSRKECTLEDSIKTMGISVDEFTSAKLIKPKIKKDFKELKMRYKVY